MGTDVYTAGRGTGDAIEQVARSLARRLEALGADAGFVAAPSGDGTRVEVARVTPYSTAPVRLAFPLDAPYPLAEVLRGGQALFIGSNDDLVCDHPGLVRIRVEDHACATLPLHGAGGAVIGSVNVSWDEPREFSDADRAAIDELLLACEAELAKLLAR